MAHAEPHRPNPPPLHEMMQGLVNRSDSMISYLQSEGLISTPVNEYSGHELDTNYAGRVQESARRDMLASELPKKQLEQHQLREGEQKKVECVAKLDPIVPYNILKKENENYTLLEHFQINKLKGKYKATGKNKFIPPEDCEIITIDDVCEQFKDNTYKSGDQVESQHCNWDSGVPDLLPDLESPGFDVLRQAPERAALWRLRPSTG